MKKNTLIPLVLGFLVFVWVIAHVVGIFWGTQNVPMHISYVADEQRPVNGALHMLQEKSMFGFRNKEEFIYGPVFAVLAVPAVVTDFAIQYISNGVRSAQDYRNKIIFDWGGIILGLRVTVVLASMLGLFFVYRMFLLKTLNPHSHVPLSICATALVGLNYFFFVNSNIFMNWMFVVILLLAQLYVALLVYESEGKRKLYWWIHGVLTVLNFGINYFNIVYMIAYLPLAVMLWRTNGEGVRRKMLMYMGMLSLGLLLIVWWNPFTFVRLVGILGLGSMANTMSLEYGSTFTPFLSRTTSFTYYTKVLLTNHVPIFLTIALLVYPIFVRRFKENFIWIWMFGSISLINFLIFGSLAHHEERYVLITTVTLLLLTGAAVIQYVTLPIRKNVIVLAISVLLISYAGYHVAHIGKWIDVYHTGPAEKRMIADVLTMQKEGESIALVQGHIAGHVHTKEAYQKFTQKKNLTDVNLYKAIMATPAPENVQALNVEYVMPKEFEEKPSLIKDFTHVIVYTQPCTLEINQATYIAENILSLWYWDDCKQTYEKIK